MKSNREKKMPTRDNGTSLAERLIPQAPGSKTVCVDKLPGESLWEHLNRGTLTRRMLEAWM
jgi:hypothetical protein